MKTRESMVEDYKKAAAELGIPVQSLQAVTWYIWKYTTNPPTVPEVTLPVETGTQTAGSLTAGG